MNQKIKFSSAAEIVENRQVRLNKHRRLITLNIEGYCYEVDLATIRSKGDLLQWVHHLASKTWMTLPALAVFIELAAAARGLNLHSDEPPTLLDDWFQRNPEITTAQLAGLEGIGARRAQERLAKLANEGWLVMSRTKGRKKFWSRTIQN